MSVLKRWTILLALAFMCAGVGHAYAEDLRHERRDHDQARQALEAGRARPLAEILERVRDQLGGRVVGVEFDREDERFVYEFKVIAPGGRLREIQVDALTAEILKREDD